MSQLGNNADSAAERAGGIGRAWAISLFIGAVFFAAVAPTLHWTQFHDPIENLNVATAMEMRHGGPLIVPNLQGYPRLAKPPLTAWITALSIRPETVASLDVRDPAARAAAYAQLIWEVRRTALLAASLLLVAAYWIGHLCAGERAGLYTACICATQWLFLRHCRLATTDIQIALWVAVTNAFLALCVFRRRRWIGCIGAGVASGVMFMAKGPVGLVQTIVPMVLFVLIARWRAPAEKNERWQAWIGPVLVGLFLASGIGGWWFVMVILRQARTMGFGPAVQYMFKFWFAEVSRDGADTVPPGKWYKHFFSLYLFMPWLIWLASGAVAAVRVILAKRKAGTDAGTSKLGDERDLRLSILGVLLLFAPMILMSFAKDRFQRYLVPLSIGAAVLSAAGVLCGAAGRRGSKWLVWGHWVLIGLIAIGLPIAMGVGIDKGTQTLDGKPQLPMTAAGSIAVAGAAVMLIGMRLQRRDSGSVVITTTLLMLGIGAMYFYGLGQTKGGRCELAGAADQIAARFPGAEIFVLGNTTKPNVITVYGNELSIYLNRPVHIVRTIDSVPASDRPQILLLTQAKKAPEVGPIPGWTRMIETHDGNAKYVLYRLP